MTCDYDSLNVYNITEQYRGIDNKTRDIEEFIMSISYDTRFELPAIFEYKHTDDYTFGMVRMSIINIPVRYQTANGTHCIEMKNVIHSFSDKPGLEMTTSFNPKRVTTHKWYEYGKIHRKNVPGYIIIMDGQIIKKVWVEDGLYNRNDGPAIIEYDLQGNKSMFHWMLDGKMYDFDVWIEQTTISIDKKIELKLNYG